MSKIILVLLLCFSFKTAALAHGDFITQQKEVGKYIVEFEYKEANILAGNPHQYVFYLLDKDTKETIPVDALFVRFKDAAGELALGAKLKTTLGESGTGRVTAVMPTTGSYTAALEFLKGDERIAAADFAFDVVPSTGTQSSTKAGSLTLAGLIGLALGFGAATLFFRKK